MCNRAGSCGYFKQINLKCKSTVHSVLLSFSPFPLLPLSLCILVKENFMFLVTQANNFEVSFFPNTVYQSPSTNSVGSTSIYTQPLITTLHDRSRGSHCSSCLVYSPAFLAGLLSAVLQFLLSTAARTSG